jgi:hypothetical protein
MLALLPLHPSPFTTHTLTCFGRGTPIPPPSDHLLRPLSPVSPPLPIAWFIDLHAPHRFGFVSASNARWRDPERRPCPAAASSRTGQLLNRSKHWRRPETLRAGHPRRRDWSAAALGLLYLDTPGPRRRDWRAVLPPHGLSSRAVASFSGTPARHTSPAVRWGIPSWINFTKIWCAVAALSRKTCVFLFRIRIIEIFRYRDSVEC